MEFVKKVRRTKWVKVETVFTSVEIIEQQRRIGKLSNTGEETRNLICNKLFTINFLLEP